MPLNWADWSYMMKKMKQVSVFLLAFITFIMTSIPVSADGVEGDKDYVPYVSFGADLKEKEKDTVLDLLGISEEELENYDVIEVTNKEEHKYLGEYLSDDVIGTRALSSVLVVKQEEGHGIAVTTENINYCTSGMYCNALITAGLKDAEVTVAGPFELTGTAALVGAMKAYAVMTGQEITEESMDAATNELVLTGALAEELGDSEKTEQLIALVKQKVFEENLATSEDIRAAVDEASDSLDLNLTEEDKESIVALMDKINELDLDVESIKSQAKDLYDKLGDIDTEGLLEKIGEFFANIFTAIADFLSGLFS
jgi:uncharacterized protein YpuA (DUF1002 family)